LIPRSLVPSIPAFTKQPKALLNRRQHAEGEAVDLENAEGVDVVLVPFDEGAVGHGAVFEGDDLAERGLGDHESADVLGEVPGEAVDLFDQADDHLDGAVVGIEAGAANGVLRDRLVAPPLERLGEHVDPVKREAEGLADVAHRRARAIGDHFGGDRSPLAAVLFVDVLEDLLAALVLEVDVDIRRLVALAADEALEEQVDAGRIDGGDAEAVADRRVGRRPAALAEDPARAGELDQVPDGEEVVFVVEFGDEGEFAFDQVGGVGGE
jgi:hypothetical protein